MPYDNERYPDEEDRKDEEGKRKKNPQQGEANIKKVGEKYMFDPQPLEEGEKPEWEK